MKEALGVRIELSGVVQGVGFRPWVYRLAQQSAVTGHVENGSRGVTIEAFGSPEAVTQFTRRLESDLPPAARVDRSLTTRIEGPAPEQFTIQPSRDLETRRFAIGPDLATCPDCLAELRDPKDRRHGYAFTNCTQCGPRISIARGIPYDRPQTTMASFVMCQACQREYDDMGDRRFHAQPNACPDCGPHLVLHRADGTESDADDPLAQAGELLRAGHVVMVKGLGGFHLACDATDDDAVLRLRQRKARDAKPFAVMVTSLAEAERFARLDDASRSLLSSAERPIVLVPRGEVALAPSVAPDSARLGLMLPYTPLHHMLLDAAGPALVMTSANLADEPTLHRDDDALELSRRVAGATLGHDRPIALRVDDSIATSIEGAPTLLRRSRGWVPRPIPLCRPIDEPVLACGAQLKNTFCLAMGDVAYLGPHIGDLDSEASYDSFVEAIDRFEAMLGVRPEVVAHDLHPDLLSTRYAIARAASRRVPVQHHHAHVASAMAEHGLEGPVVGIAFDGTGFGPDGRAWGGEILLADRQGFSRLATLRPMPLLGGERAIAEPWRLALALLDDAFDGAAPLEGLELFALVGPRRVEQLRAVARAGLAHPWAHGAGRYFDAFAALILARPTASYEAQLAMALEHSVTEPTQHEFEIARDGELWSIDLRPMTREVVAALRRGDPPGRIAMGVHRTLAAAAVAAVRRGPENLPVVLTGGCFQNAIFTAAVVSNLQDDRDVLIHRQAPPNDGGIALGQAWIASAPPPSTRAPEA